MINCYILQQQQKCCNKNKIYKITFSNHNNKIIEYISMSNEIGQKEKKTKKN